MAVGAIAALSLTVAGLGVATAANGGSLTLGQRNVATKTTTLKDSKGTPLALVGKRSKPPLRVNSSKRVKHLNASLLDNHSAQDLMTTGAGTNFFSPNPTGSAISTEDLDATRIATTPKLPAGRYFVMATAEIVSTGGAGGSFCFLGFNGDSSSAHAQGVGATPKDDYGNAVESTIVVLPKPATVGEYCFTNGDSASVYGGGIQALTVDRLRSL